MNACINFNACNGQILRFILGHGGDETVFLVPELF